MQAQAIEALGKANAEAEKLRLSAYSAQSVDNFVKIEVAKALGNSLSGIKGYLPADMKVMTLGENYLKAVDNVMKAGAIAGSVSEETK